MAAGRAPMWFLVAAPGVLVIALGVWNVLPASDATETGADAPTEAPAAALPPTVAPSNTTAPTTDPACVAPPCDDRASDSTEGGVFPPRDVLTSTAITARIVDAGGRPVSSVLRVRFWTPKASWRTWLAFDGSFAVDGPPPAVDIDVDAVFPSRSVPDGHVGRFHLGTARAGDRDLMFRLPVSPVTIAAGVLVDANDRPLAGWRVEAHANVNGVPVARTFAEAATDRNGRFSVIAWFKPEFTLQVRAPGGVGRALDRRDVIAGNGELRLTAARPIVSGLLALGDGASPAGAAVRLRDAARGVDRTTIAASDGSFVFDNLDDGATYEISAELAGHVCLTPVRHASDRRDASVQLFALGQVVEGRAADADGRPLRFSWLRFVASDPWFTFQTLTDVDGRFSSVEAWPIDFDVYLLVPGPEERLVPGPKLGRARGGNRKLELRVPR